MSKKEIINKIIEEGLSKEELSAEEIAHFEQGELEGIFDIFNGFDELEIPQISNSEEFRNTVFEKSIWAEKEAESGTKIRKSDFRVWKWMAAASVVFFSIFFVRYFHTKNELTVALTKKSEHRSFFLPDSSRVTLNAASRLEYKAGDWAREREVYLEGEAFFEVVQGSRFRVVSKGGYTTEVLGTKFNVKSRNGWYTVDCLSGKVAVKAPGGKRQILTRGWTTSNLETDSLEVPVQLDYEKLAGWRNGHFHFVGVKFGSVLTELEQQFDIEIKVAKGVKGIYDREYSGHFYNDDLNTALQLVFIPMDIEYSYSKKDKVVLLEN
ncbi:MAG: FecR domain-containing protein [Cytophagales bacterium]|nr:FecR domain-containing protein [Cytophagales bacterium]